MDTVPDIDWNLISGALSFYKCFGYTYVEVPWIVPSTVNMLTCPHEDLLMKIEGTTTSLVGSAEQSFLKMDLDGHLPKGKYMACTPCFRVETANDGLHFPTFLKVELYRTDRVDATALYEAVRDAEAFIGDTLRWSHGSTLRNHLKRVSTPEGIDLMFNGIEIGSYGMRARGGFTWVYGTGLALPRFTQARIVQT